MHTNECLSLMTSSIDDDDGRGQIYEEEAPEMMTLMEI